MRIVSFRFFFSPRKRDDVKAPVTWYVMHCVPYVPYWRLFATRFSRGRASRWRPLPPIERGGGIKRKPAGSPCTACEEAASTTVFVTRVRTFTGAREKTRTEKTKGTLRNEWRGEGKKIKIINKNKTNRTNLSCAEKYKLKSTVVRRSRYWNSSRSRQW